MASRHPRNLVLTGISTSGKSTVGRQLAELLGLKFVDLDVAIERNAGRSIPEIFSYDGEKGFRDLETAELRQALTTGDSVISTGGGIVLRKENRQLIESQGIVICLDAQVETVYARLGGGRPRRPGRPVRPLLDGPNPLERITDMKRERAYWYSLADWTIHTDHLRVDEVVKEAERAWKVLLPRLSDPQAVRPGQTDLEHPPVVATPGGKYPLYVGSGILGQLGTRLLEHELTGRVFILADEHAAAYHGQQLLNSLASSGLAGEIFTIPSGDQSKDLGLARRMYDWLAERRVERRETIVAFGGGVAGDLGGFVAATWLRGIPLIQVPTTLLAMTDSSIGGKVGVNLPSGKNLVGSFYQPRFVLADVETLASLGRREVVAGWAETIKHGLIRDIDLLERLESGVEKLLDLDRSVLSDIIRRSSAVKAHIVSTDEREDGLRMLLNYGHTIGHALEAAGGYQKLLHGEAVAIGMKGAARISQELGLLSGDESERQARIIRRFGLPDMAESVPLDKVVSALTMDKKVQAKKLRWILLDGIGNAVTKPDVPVDLVDRTIQGLIK